MGSWGADIFDDDSAYDYADELAADPLAFFRHSFATALLQTHVGFDESHAVTVSAAHLDAIANGTAYRNDAQEEFDAWVASHKSLDVTVLKPLAVRALQHVIDSSDLADLWSESELAEEWFENVSALQSRLS